MAFGEHCTVSEAQLYFREDHLNGGGRVQSLGDRPADDDTVDTSPHRLVRCQTAIGILVISFHRQIRRPDIRCVHGHVRFGRLVFLTLHRIERIQHDHILGCEDEAVHARFGSKPRQLDDAGFHAAAIDRRRIVCRESREHRDTENFGVGKLGLQAKHGGRTRVAHDGQNVGLVLAQDGAVSLERLADVVELQVGEDFQAVGMDEINMVITHETQRRVHLDVHAGAFQCHHERFHLDPDRFHPLVFQRLEICSHDETLV